MTLSKSAMSPTVRAIGPFTARLPKGMSAGASGIMPTVGLIPLAPADMPFGNLAVKGPMARTVGDIALLLNVMAGADARDPACYPMDPAVFTKPLERNLKNVRVAWCPDLGGLPLHPEVRAVLSRQRATFEQLGCLVEDAHP